MPSISPVNTLPTLHEKADVGNTNKLRSESTTTSPKKSPRLESPTFGEKLKAARRLISLYPGKAKLVRSDSESSDGMSDCSSHSSHSESGQNGCIYKSAELESRSFFRDYSIILEYKYVSRNPQSGVYVVPSLNSLQVWHGIIFLRAGPYRDGIFRFVIYLQDDFPSSRPLLKFTTPIFHPQVHVSGSLNLDKAFPNWLSGRNHIWQILRYMKGCFYKADTWCAVNENAANIAHSSLDDFKTKAKQCAVDSIVLFDDECKKDITSSDDDGNILRYRKMSDWALREGKRLLIAGEVPSFDPRELPSRRNSLSP